MTPFTTLTGIAAPLGRANVDTDLIIPKQFLKTVTREGLARGLFYDLSTGPDGQPDPAFVLNQPAYAGAQILIAGPNFGCGSSREHAPWALLDAGIRCVIASSFADIFFNNCFNNGLLPLVLPQNQVEALLDQARGANHVFQIDLAAQTVTAPDGGVWRFDIEPARKHKLLTGLDDIGVTMSQESAIADFETRRRFSEPWAR